MSVEDDHEGGPEDGHPGAEDGGEPVEQPTDTSSLADSGSDAEQEDVFGDIYGHNGAKVFIGNALRDGGVHVALQGPPGSGKSTFLLALEANVPGTIYRDGDQITAAKLRDVLKNDPPILLIDEIDALDNEAYDVLSTPLEHGRLVRDSARETYDVEVGTQVIAACNDLGELPENIRNRFQVQNFQKYDEQQFLDLCEKMLVNEVEWVDSGEDARKAGKLVMGITGEPDPRTTRDVAQMAQSMDEIEAMTAAMEDPDADVEAKPLAPGDIARAEDEVAKAELRDTLVEDMMESTRPEPEPEGETGATGEDVSEETAESIDGEIEEAVEEAVADGTA